jgi:hypothetical protein
MTAWAMFPAMGFAENSSHDEQSVVGLASCVGCLLGSAVAASTFREVAAATAAVAGALTSALSLGVVAYANRRVVMTIDELTLSIVLLSTLAAVAGMYLGRVMRARPGLAAAAVVLASGGAGVILTSLREPRESDRVALAILVFSPAVGTMVATLLCESMPLRPRSIASWLFVLLLTMFVIVAIATSADEGDGSGHVVRWLVGGALVAGLAAGGAALVTFVMHKLRPPKDAVVVPQAQVVER